MKTITLDQIKKILPSLDLLRAIEEGFAAYSAGKAVVPPVSKSLRRFTPQACNSRLELIRFSSFILKTSNQIERFLDREVSYLLNQAEGRKLINLNSIQMDPRTDT